MAENCRKWLKTVEKSSKLSFSEPKRPKQHILAQKRLKTTFFAQKSPQMTVFLPPNYNISVKPPCTHNFSVYRCREDNFLLFLLSLSRGWRNSRLWIYRLTSSPRWEFLPMVRKYRWTIKQRENIRGNKIIRISILRISRSSRLGTMHSVRKRSKFLAF